MAAPRRSERIRLRGPETVRGNAPRAGNVRGRPLAARTASRGPRRRRSYDELAQDMDLFVSECREREDEIYRNLPGRGAAPIPSPAKRRPRQPRARDAPTAGRGRGARARLSFGESPPFKESLLLSPSPLPPLPSPLPPLSPSSSSSSSSLSDGDEDEDDEDDEDDEGGSRSEDEDEGKDEGESESEEDGDDTDKDDRGGADRPRGRGSSRGATLPFFPNSFLNGEALRVFNTILSDDGRHFVAKLRDSIPMPPYVLDLITIPPARARYLRAGELVRAVLKWTIMTNYYYDAEGRLANAKTCVSRLFASAEAEECKARLEAIARSGGEPDMALVARVFGRLTVTPDQYDRCRGVLMRAVATTPASMKAYARRLRRTNMLARGVPVDGAFAEGLYVKNLEALRAGKPSELRTAFTEGRTSRKDVLNDAAFALCVADMLRSFIAAMNDLQALVLHRLHELADTLYLTYIQVPHLRREYAHCVREIVTRTQGKETLNFCLRGTAAALLCFTERAVDAGSMLCPGYVRFALRAAARDGTASGSEDPDDARDGDVTVSTERLDHRHLFRVRRDVDGIVGRRIVFVESTGAVAGDLTAPTRIVQVRNPAAVVAELLDRRCRPREQSRPAEVERTDRRPERFGLGWEEDDDDEEEGAGDDMMMMTS